MHGCPQRVFEGAIDVGVIMSSTYLPIQQQAGLIAEGPGDLQRQGVGGRFWLESDGF